MWEALPCPTHPEVQAPLLEVSRGPGLLRGYRGQIIWIPEAITLLTQILFTLEPLFLVIAVINID